MSSRLAPVPQILPVADDVARPFWSVMIPTYNSSQLLELTLRSVLDQDPGPQEMEIVVVDDRSTNGAAEATVQRLASGRVKFLGNRQNLGLAGNWNRCLLQSRGDWVHLLHQDDIVLPGFYERFGPVLRNRPDLGMAFCRHGYINGDGEPIGQGDLLADKAGEPEGWVEMIAVGQRLECPAVVVKREVYEQLGGFDPSLVYTLDWEMWARISSSYSVWYDPEIFAYYRRHDANESARLAGESRQLPDILKTVEVNLERITSARKADLRREAARLLCWRRMDWANHLMNAGKAWSALQEVAEAQRLEGFSTRLITLSRYGKWALKVWMGKLALKRGMGTD